jgi:hypothetical protein
VLLIVDGGETGTLGNALSRRGSMASGCNRMDEDVVLVNSRKILQGYRLERAFQKTKFAAAQSKPGANPTKERLETI